MTLVDQPGSEGVGGEFRTPDEGVMFPGRSQLSNRLRIKRLLKPRFAGGYSLQRPGVHVFVRCLPALSEVAHICDLLAQTGIGLPHPHTLIHSRSIESHAR